MAMTRNAANECVQMTGARPPWPASGISKRSSREKSLICIVAPTLVVQGGLPSGYGRIRMGTDVTVSQPVAVRHRGRRTKLKKKIDATQPGRRVRTY